MLRGGVERLRALDATIRELKAILENEIAVQFEVPPEPTWRPLSRISIVLVVLGILLAGGPVVLKSLGIADLGAIVQIAGGIIAVVGLAMAAVALWLRRSVKNQTQLRDVEIDRRLRGRSEMEAELVDAELRTKAELTSLGLPDLAAAEDLLAREDAHIAQIDLLGAQLDGLVGKEPPSSLVTMRDTAALDIAQRTSALEALGPIAKEPRARERLEVEVQDQEKALESARDDEANARARVEANGVDAEQIAGQAERLVAWQEQLATAQRRQRVFAITLEAIDRAEQATMKSATRYLEAHMGGDLAAVTDGRYRRVRVDDKTLDIEVHAPEKDDWVPVSSLSQGTLDLVYLVARLGLVRLVTGDRRPPLIFDDPFVTLDDARAGRALTLLKGIAADFQVIYMTTSSRYDEAADAVVVLDGPTSVDGGAIEGTRRRGRALPLRRPRFRHRAGAPDRPRRGGERDDPPRSAVGGRLGIGRLRWWPADPPDRAVQRRARLAAGRHGAGVRTEPVARRDRAAPHGPVLERPVRCVGWRRDHGALPRPRGRADGRRGAGHRGHGGADPGRRRDRARGCPVGVDARRDRAGDRGRGPCLARRATRRAAHRACASR